MGYEASKEAKTIFEPAVVSKSFVPAFFRVGSQSTQTIQWAPKIFYMLRTHSVDSVSMSSTFSALCIVLCWLLSSPEEGTVDFETSES